MQNSRCVFHLSDVHALQRATRDLQHFFLWSSSSATATPCSLDVNENTPQPHPKPFRDVARACVRQVEMNANTPPPHLEPQHRKMQSLQDVHDYWRGLPPAGLNLLQPVRASCTRRSLKMLVSLVGSLAPIFWVSEIYIYIYIYKVYIFISHGFWAQFQTEHDVLNS